MKKLFSLLMAALLMGAMISCNSNGASNKASKTEDSIATELGKLIGNSLKGQLSQNPNFAEEIDQAELMRGIEAVLKCDTTKKSKSYLNGLAIALQMIYPGIAQAEAQGITVDRRAFLNEFKKAFKSKDSVDMDKLQGMQANLMGLMQRVAQVKGVENDKKGQKYIEEKMKKDKGFKKTASGIAYKILKQGTGENFNDSATVDVIYVGRHIDGKEFDSSKGKPTPFNLKQVVPGFTEVLTMMNPGSKIIAIIPGSLAYGEQGNPQGGILPNETLEFEITAEGLHKDEPVKKPAMPGQMPGRPAPAPKAAK